jgi:hormone-sensitive lipase
MRHLFDFCVPSEIDNKSFPSSFVFREVEACNHVLAAMITFFNHLLMLHSWSENGNLFPVQEQKPEDILERARTVNQSAFYGRCLGFHYAESIKPIMKLIAILMASFSESYYSNNGTFIKATNSMFTSGKYFFDPELRSRRIVGLSQNSSVDFCKVISIIHTFLPRFLTIFHSLFFCSHFGSSPRTKY